MPRVRWVSRRILPAPSAFRSRSLDFKRFPFILFRLRPPPLNSTTARASGCNQGLHNLGLPELDYSFRIVSSKSPPSSISLTRPSLPGENVPQLTPFVTELVRRMQANILVVVRGNPAIGKTTILEQTANHFLKHHAERPLFVITGWDQEKVERAGGWELHVRAITGISGQTWRATEAVLLLDEAQCSYWDLNLWSVFFKAVHGEQGLGPWVSLFASYGSRGDGLDEN